MKNPNHTLIGIGLMLGAMAMLPLMDVFAKYLGQMGLPVVQIVWARLTFGALVSMPFALKSGGRGAFLPQRPGVHLARAVFLVLATFTFFSSLTYLPIPDALAIFFVQPLIVVILSALVLRESVGPRRWTAVVIGFVGTLIIIRPGFAAFNPGTLMALAAGSCLAIYFVITRHIAGMASAMVTTFQTNAIGMILVSLWVPFVWIAPTPDQWLMFAGLGAIATLGHYLIVRAYDFAEASLLAPFAYTEMIGATICGWYFFGDLPDRYTILGVTILIGSAIYISWREARRD